LKRIDAIDNLLGTYSENFQELNEKPKDSDNIFIIKGHILNLVELLFPAFVSALEQYYKNKLFEKLSKLEFREVFIINRKKFSKVLNEFDIKDRVIDEMLDHGLDSRLINLGNYIKDNR
ncbi:MAG: hypothetical protein ACFFG0_43425, partial [Candidatus Thorarchaeota archaeon]